MSKIFPSGTIHENLTTEIGEFDLQRVLGFALNHLGRYLEQFASRDADGFYVITDPNPVAPVAKRLLDQILTARQEILTLDRRPIGPEKLTRQSALLDLMAYTSEELCGQGTQQIREWIASCPVAIEPV